MHTLGVLHFVFVILGRGFHLDDSNINSAATSSMYNATCSINGSSIISNATSSNNVIIIAININILSAMLRNAADQLRAGAQPGHSYAVAGQPAVGWHGQAAGVIVATTGLGPLRARMLVVIKLIPIVLFIVLVLVILLVIVLLRVIIILYFTGV